MASDVRHTRDDGPWIQSDEHVELLHALDLIRRNLLHVHERPAEVPYRVFLIDLLDLLELRLNGPLHRGVNLEWDVGLCRRERNAAPFIPRLRRLRRPHVGHGILHADQALTTVDVVDPLVAVEVLDAGITLVELRVGRRPRTAAAASPRPAEAEETHRESVLLLELPVEVHVLARAARRGDACLAEVLQHLQTRALEQALRKVAENPGLFPELVCRVVVGNDTREPSVGIALKRGVGQRIDADCLDGAAVHERRVSRDLQVQRVVGQNFV